MKRGGILINSLTSYYFVTSLRLTDRRKSIGAFSRGPNIQKVNGTQKPVSVRPVPDPEFSPPQQLHLSELLY